MKGYYDIRGDGGSRVVEQVAEQRARIARRLSGVRHRLAIASGKGGVGKSTLTTLLALALNRQGTRVAILDADFNGPCQARLGGLPETPLVPGADGIPLPRSRAGIGLVSMGMFFPEPDAVDFPTVAEGESYVWRATREFAALGELMGSIEWGALDVLLFDLPPGAERTLQYAEYLGPETAFLLVTVPSDLSRGVVARSAASLAKTPNPILGYVENMKGYWCETCGEVRPLFPEQATVELPLPCLGSLPFDPELARLADLGEIAAGDPSRPVFTEAEALARRVAESLEAAP